MYLRISCLLSALLAGSAGLVAQTGAIDGYTLGFVYDGRSLGLKPLVGIPGAALLGGQLDAGVQIKQAYVSPRQNYAIALTETDVLVASFRSTTDPPAVATLGFASSAANIVTLSSNGAAGAFYSSNEAVIRIVTGLPDAPSIARTLPTAAVTGTLRLLAISNDGTQLIVTADGSTLGNLIRLDADGNPIPLPNSSHPSALQFIGDSGDLLVADDVDDTVSIVKDVGGAGLLNHLAGAADGIAGPIGLSASIDGKQIVVANGRNGNILVLDANGPARGSYACPCNPAELGRLNGNSVFLLNGIADNSPLWIFDGDSATPRVMFIPAEDAGTAGSNQ
jgi:hypothetical protein